MTRATDKPVRRIVMTTDGEMVVGVTDRCLTLRPVRTRAGGPAEVQVPYGAIYLRAMVVRVEAERRVRRSATPKRKRK